MADRPFVPLGLAVVTVSDTRTLETDTSGKLLADELGRAGHRIADRRIEHMASADVDVVLVTGGTGITARDVTPDALAPLVTKPLPGFGELFRWLSYADIGAATIQSRAEAALCDTTLVFALPGSTGACRLALEKILLPQLDARTRPCNFAELMPRVRGTARG
jgi:molybdenum cofactor biosynthesis protein B